MSVLVHVISVKFRPNPLPYEPSLFSGCTQNNSDLMTIYI